MRRAVLCLFMLLALAATLPAEVGFTRVSATATAQTITIDAGSLTVVNDGASEVYVRIFTEGETPSDATTSKAEIKSGESLEFTRTLSIHAISLVCASGETASVRLFYW